MQHGLAARSAVLLNLLLLLLLLLAPVEQL
jgi:hypothetical protein